jgi:hypothetical protein
MAQITVVNNSDEVVRIAIYRKPVLLPTLSTIAWRIVEPPPNGGQTVVQIPENYSVFANYSFDTAEREDANAGNRTNVIQFAEDTARFIVGTAVSQDRRANAATLVQTFDGLVMNETRIVNQFGYGVWGHITKDGDDVYAPQVIWPGAVMMEDLRESFFLAAVSQFVYKGDRLVQEETSLTETEVLAGGMATVTGSKWKGYAIA